VADGVGQFLNELPIQNFLLIVSLANLYGYQYE
jgi:hypothetical protein